MNSSFFFIRDLGKLFDYCRKNFIIKKNDIGMNETYRGEEFFEYLKKYIVEDLQEIEAENIVF